MNTYHAFHPDFAAVIRPKAELRQLASGMAFTEGPVYLPDQQCVLFSDIPNNTIMRWDEQDGLSTWVARSHFAIGLTLDSARRVIACEHATKRLARYEEDGTATVLAASHGGAALNSTNDVALHPGGALYFTDPPFGVRSEAGELVGYQVGMDYGGCFVFRVTDDPHAPQPIITDIHRPNGLCFSPDGSVLYVSDSSERFHQVYAADMQPDGSATNLRVFCVCPAGVPDGMRVDTIGRLYVSALDGVYVYAPDATLLGRINVPEMVTNCTFGGKSKQALFITAVSSLYAVDLAATGV